MIHTDHDLIAATDALANWCRSQSLGPHDAVAVMELTLARMIVESESSAADGVDKLHEIVSAIWNMIHHLKESHDPSANR